jgi:predicted Zn finger-like uncharacterized protein
MAADVEIRVRCPDCGAKYRLPASAAGRKARCAKCGRLFRAESNTPGSNPSDRKAPVPQRSRPHVPKGVPSEDDILRWLAEAEDEADRERRSSLDDTDDLMAMGEEEVVKRQL